MAAILVTSLNLCQVTFNSLDNELTSPDFPDACSLIMHTEFCFFQHLTLTVHIALKGNSILLLSEHPQNIQSLRHLLEYCNIKHRSKTVL